MSAGSLFDICHKILDIDPVIKNLLCNWHFIIPSGLHKFSYPEKLTANGLIVCVLHHKSTFFSHYSQQILENIWSYLGNRSIDKIIIKQISKDKNLHSTEVEKSEKYTIRSVEKINFKQTFSKDQIFEIIDNELCNDLLKESLKNLYFSIINDISINND